MPGPSPSPAVLQRWLPTLRCRQPAGAPGNASAPNSGLCTVSRSDWPACSLLLLCSWFSTLHTFLKTKANWMFQKEDFSVLSPYPLPHLNVSCHNFQYQPLQCWVPAEVLYFSQDNVLCLLNPALFLALTYLITTCISLHLCDQILPRTRQSIFLFLNSFGFKWP